MKTVACGFVLLSVLVGVNGLAVREIAAEDKGRPDASYVGSTVVYRVSDLPLWTAEKQFDPAILMRLIEKTLPPTDLEENGGVTTMAAYPKKASILVHTNERNHKKIQALLTSMRTVEPPG